MDKGMEIAAERFRALRDLWQEGKLVENVPALVEALSERGDV